MSGLPGFLSDSRVLLFWNDGLIGLPKIAGAVSCSIGRWNGFPQATTRLFAAISHCVSDDLPRLATQSDPDPGLIGLFEHKGPEFIQFQHRRLRIVGIRLNQRFAQGWQFGGFF